MINIGTILNQSGNADWICGYVVVICTMWVRDIPVLCGTRNTETRRYYLRQYHLYLLSNTEHSTFNRHETTRTI